MAGVWLSVRSAGVIDIWELAGVRQAITPNSQPLRLTNSQEPAVVTQDRIGSWSTETVGSWEFKTTGPYGLVRHPIYLGWFLMVFGVPIMTNTRLVFALVSCGYLLLAIPLEERSLRRASDGKYDEYIRAVRWKLIPGLYYLTPNSQRLSLPQLPNENSQLPTAIAGRTPNSKPPRLFQFKMPNSQCKP